MNVIAMVHEILLVANAMIGKSPLPNLSSAEGHAKGVGISPLNQLYGSL